MRIFNKQRRISLSGKSDAELFLPEAEWYRNNNQYHVEIFGKHIINIYRRINVQIVLTKVCNLKCKFCIEREIMPATVGGANWLPWYVREVLSQYKEQGVIPTVSITGGEPTLFPDRLFNILDIIGSFLGGVDGIKFVNINTNGTNLAILDKFPWLRINVSRHHFNYNVNEEIFGTAFSPFDTKLERSASFQCVLMKGYIDSVQQMKRYMDTYFYSANGFSFRGLTTLDEQKGYVNEIAFTKEHFVDVKPILDAIANDPEFEFIQQKIGDHYVYELYKYRGKVLRIVYSNFAWLRQIETEERKQGDCFSRATIIHPNAVYSGWTYDLNLIHAKKLTI